VRDIKDFSLTAGHLYQNLQRYGASRHLGSRPGLTAALIPAPFRKPAVMIRAHAAAEGNTSTAA